MQLYAVHWVVIIMFCHKVAAELQKKKTQFIQLSGYSNSLVLWCYLYYYYYYCIVVLLLIIIPLTACNVWMSVNTLIGTINQHGNVSITGALYSFRTGLTLEKQSSQMVYNYVSIKVCL